MSHAWTDHGVPVRGMPGRGVSSESEKAKIGAGLTRALPDSTSHDSLTLNPRRVDLVWFHWLRSAGTGARSRSAVATGRATTREPADCAAPTQLVVTESGGQLLSRIAGQRVSMAQSISPR